MERDKIIKALECCSKDDCDNCPNNFGNCYANLAGYALSLIKELTEDVEWSAKRIIEADKKGAELTKANEEYRTENMVLSAEVERLTEDNEAQAETITNLIETIKTIQADTVRKMKERLKEEYEQESQIGFCNISVDGLFRTIDQIAKEMLEGNNDND